ncbi:protein cappuccino-like [Tropilaelaps mercedesae]|uniref:Protein cappuccino-like n=1 Tax=Tropilaelaps mercedesae TaxID=418985 RepID=A0A1V9Y291_9ACAR|nr:protein cappuccino-like [Tropilaelaps mercedesae]
MESKVEQAESLFTTSYQQKLFKVFQSALGSSTSSNASGGQYRRQVRFEPPDLFRIEEYFPPPSPGRRLAVSATARSSVDSEARLPELQRSDNSI